MDVEKSEGSHGRVVSTKRAPNDREKEAVRAFVQEMEETTIPRITESMNHQRAAASNTRLWQLKH